MTDMQLKLLDMMKFFHDFCISENLKYYVIGGTALGAIRHQGFIPWDDDIDVGMPRDDYEKLKAKIAQASFENYRFEFFGTAKEFAYTFGKMYDKNTTLIEDGRYPIKRGIYLDIFPLDGAGNEYDECMSHYKRIKKIGGIIFMKSCGKRKGRKLYKRVLISAVRCLPEFILSTQRLVSKHEKLCKNKSWNDSVYIANYSGMWGEREIAKKEWFGAPVERDFQNIKVMCPQYTEKYLTAVYGDWQTPPPADKQKSHHQYIYMSLNKSYLSK